MRGVPWCVPWHMAPRGVSAFDPHVCAEAKTPNVKCGVHGT